MKTHPLIESESDGDDCGHGSVNEDKGDINSKENKIGHHVIVKYDNSFYPGKIIEKYISKYLISVMVSSSINKWRWPVNKDEIWYDKEEITQIIPEPIGLNKRGIIYY
ncbi:unnamed protein product [Psylliodes chrysocephalus]|uniref:Uncharacterized protein n=1 Tax=Psylliodes chrysocephalus TaxID=3402493 RepID=A0A9P0D086_9CUCU|nr:unnamed protein product [Psylliodes chrysocephala]